MKSIDIALRMRSSKYLDSGIYHLRSRLSRICFTTLVRKNLCDVIRKEITELKRI